MTFTEYRQYDALGLAELIRKKEITAAELVQIAITRAESVNPTINAIVHPLYDMAQKMAREADPDSPFAGVPFLVKDLSLEVAGTHRSSGCRGYRDYISKEDSVIIQRYRQAGLSFLGKTSTPEFGLTPYTEPKEFGPTRNPWNIGYTAGGSSGGSAAAVAAGITPMATASDGGGSIRIPASCCGLFGLKPSRGRISMGPQQGEGWSGAVMEHCVSRSVRDSAALLDATQGPAPGDPFIIQPPEKPYLEVIKEDPGKLRIGFSTAHTLGQEVEMECILAVEKTAQLLESLGHQVELAPLPYRREDLTETFLTMVCGEAAADIETLSRHLGRPARPGDVERATWAMVMLGRSFSAKDYAYQRRKWNDIARRIGAFHQQYDLLLTPTVSKAPFRIGALQPDAAEQRLLRLVTSLNLEGVLKARVGPLAEKIFSYIPYTALSNITGQPSMSVPLHWTEDKLPVGVMFTAPAGREDRLFRLAAQLEKAQPWKKKMAEV
ncbi:MAG: amidase [Lewinellaceae bacterium]|nr:amidase [Phaeodactylibacter sp.]MCB9350819.1 amidase [Lewinellaceae bacterium]